MDDGDSDSSLSDVGSGITTNVLLGYATKETVDDTFSQIGGEPRWLDAAKLPPAQLARCKNCRSFMALLLQLNGNLPSKFPGHDRSLYIWACRRKACRRKEGCVRGFRCTRVSKPAVSSKSQGSKGKSKSQNLGESQTHQQKDIGSALFGATSSMPASGATNPFSTSSSGAASTSAANPFSTSTTTIQGQSTVHNADLAQTFAEKARLSSPAPESFPVAQTYQEKPEVWPRSSEFPEPYPSYFLDAEYEYLSPKEDSKSNGQSGNYESLMDTERSGTDRNTEDAAYESEHDKTFQHFADAIAQNPEQILRYEFGAAPLLYSRSDAVGQLLASSSPAEATNSKLSVQRAAGSTGFPACSYCKAHRVFELQLTPHAITELEAEEEAATLLGEGMEWGTIIMAVCSQDCGGPQTSPDDDDDDDDATNISYVEEWVGVQWEELVQRSARRQQG